MRSTRHPRLSPPALTALAAVLSACQSVPTGPTPQLTELPRALSAPEREVIAGSNAFAFELLQAVNATQRDENVFISPLSVSMALGMTMNGAAGATFEEMRSTLGFAGLSQVEINESYRGLIDLLLDLDPDVDIALGNSVWYRQEFPFEPSFFETVEQSFDAEVEGLDFASPASVERINDWVDAATSGRIDSIVDEIRADDVMFLINAIYFKGAWRERFDPDRTSADRFTGLDGQQVAVQMMTNDGTFRYATAGDVQVLDLPYGNGAFTMTLLLPSPDGDVNTFLESLDAARWAELIEGLTESRIMVSLPRFRLEYEKTLNDPLQALGMVSAFVPNGADFTRMSSTAGRDLYISYVKHKSFVEVNEEGTEAAAVTSVGVRVTSMPPHIRFDRPFIFAIRERFSGTILFTGKIVAPSD